MGLIFFILLNITPTQTPLVYKRLTPPYQAAKKELTKVLAHLPKARLKLAKGFSSNSPILYSPPFWFTDEGNVYYYKYIRNSKYQLQSLLKGSNTHSFSKISPFSVPQVGVLPDGTMVIARNHSFYFYSPKGDLLRKKVVPLSNPIVGFHSIGNGDLLIWDKTNLLYMKNSGVIKWRQVLSKPLASMRNYGISNFFIVELTNKKMESRSWKTGKIAWSKPIGAGLFGFVTGGNIMLCTDLKIIKIIDPAKGTILKSYKMPWNIKTIYFAQTNKGFFIYMEGYRLGYMDLRSGKFKWITELGAPLGNGSTNLKGNLVVTWSNKFLAFSAKGKIVWSLPIPNASNQKIKFFKVPGGNIGFATKNKVYFLYPPLITLNKSKGSTK
jgi:hypothetical protein